MFSNEYLQKYLDAIDIEKVKAIRELLPHYRFGFHTKQRLFKELQVHTGYEKTISRYMVNRTLLTYEQIMEILRLYDISNIPGVEVVEQGAYFIINVPTPSIAVSISEVLFKITKVPDVIIENEETKNTVDIIMLPAPEVQLDVDTIVLEHLITKVPVPIVSNLGGIELDKYQITFVPEPLVLTDIGVLNDVEITLVPEPLLQIGDSGYFVITEVPEPVVALETDVEPDSRIFYGVFTGPTRPGSKDIDLGTLISKQISPIPSDLEIDFPREVGYYIFAIPSGANPRRSWYISDLNQGPIGGSADDVWSNAWPDPELAIYNNNSYQIYIGSYITEFEEPVILRDYLLTTKG